MIWLFIVNFFVKQTESVSGQHAPTFDLSCNRRLNLAQSLKSKDTMMLLVKIIKTTKNRRKNKLGCLPTSAFFYGFELGTKQKIKLCQLNHHQDHQKALH